MKKDFVKRALCLVCCLTLTLGAFAYRPTKAEAVFISPAAALGASLLASVVVGTTATFFVSSGAADTIGTAIDGLVREFVSTTADLAGYTSDMFFEEIPNGLVVLQDGAIQLSAAAGNLTARFINWLQTDSGYVVPGERVSIDNLEYSYSFNDGVLACHNTDTDYFVPGDFVLKADSLVEDEPYIFTTFEDGSYIRFLWESGTLRTSLYSSAGVELAYTQEYYWFIEDFSAEYLYLGTTFPSLQALVLFYVDAIGSVAVTRTVYHFDKYPSYSPVKSTAELESYSSLRALPNEIPDYSYLSITPGVQALDFADPQAAADDIMDAIYAGTLAPTVSIEAQATDVPGTDTDEEDDVIAVPGADADLLDWTKYIGQKVAAIPQAIAKAVAGVFAPDAALVNEIAGAFSAKFGFVETLKQVGDDLFGMNASSQPPVVWIHLEDAEGRYNYGGTVKALDMSWYQRYKADVDRIFGGFLWIAYLWLLFKRLPDIISGAGMAAADNMYVGEFEMVSGQKFTARRSKRL